MLRRYRTLNNDTEVNVDGARLRAGDDGVFVVEAGSREEDVLIAGGAISAHLFSMLFDEDGNLIANVNHRTGTLAFLLSQIGGSGEIAVPNDVAALVKYDSAGVGHVYGGFAPIASISVGCSDVRSIGGTGTAEIIDLDEAQWNYGNLLTFDAVNNCINGLPVGKLPTDAICLYEISALAEFASSVAGTKRNLTAFVDQAAASFSTIYTGQMSNSPLSSIPPSALGNTRLEIPRIVFAHSNEGYMPRFHVRAAQDTGGALNLNFGAFRITATILQAA